MLSHSAFVSVVCPTLSAKIKTNLKNKMNRDNASRFYFTDN